MKNLQKFLIFIVILIIFPYLISALEGYIDVTESQPEKKGEIPSIEKAPPEPEKPSEKEKTECEQEGGICRCDCLETEFDGYGRLGCPLTGCGFFSLESYGCCKLRSKIETKIKEEGKEVKQAEEKQEHICPDECYDDNRDGIVDVFDMVEVAGKIEKATDDKEREKLLNRLVCIKRVFGEKQKEWLCLPVMAEVPKLDF